MAGNTGLLWRWKGGITPRDAKGEPSQKTIGRLCEKCDGKCVICDSYVRPCTLVRICDECNYGSYQGRCVICGGPGVSDAYYCKECTIQEKDRDGCPKIVNLGSSKTDLFYERKKYGFKKR
ncbi:PHD finger-like domain-containing protein 5A isoform X1 [Microcaecilia unicolor]|uniref:PHD finger-like domain-containing protein 5A isoform X1 n=1 Tax=Microcaecilia unicolor TaxID=1415580 RepID=A0A6P7YNE3_9AMPH|nr:PHD finger-like domain-containing protein 5A isoform X1 [Microcaecilia unicolor]XP_030066271.1 PHD finger-like domain-containing protein 5A isoform X1 [Microcaecilia unicolor]